jgi:hypothetical protein
MVSRLRRYGADIQAVVRLLLFALVLSPRAITLYAICALIAFGVSLGSVDKSAFSVQAQSGSLVLEPGCGREIVWDLPPGHWLVSDPGQPPPLQAQAEAVAPPPVGGTLRLRASARVTLERRGDAPLRLRLERSSTFADCAHGLPAIEAKPASDEQDWVRIASGGESARSLHYTAADASAPFVLPLEGRIVLGATLQHGGGWSDTDPPLLEGATVDVRTIGGGQSRNVLSEKVDTGSIIDTAPCFDEERGAGGRGAKFADCPVRSRPPALGFVRPAADGGGLSVQLHVQNDAISIRPYQGEARRLSVTIWQWLIGNYFVQAFVAVLVLLGGAAQFLDSFGLMRKHDWVGSPNQPVQTADAETMAQSPAGGAAPTAEDPR